MKKVTKILSLLLIVAVAVTFAACGGGSGSVAGKTFALDKDASSFGDAEEEAALILSMCDEFSIKFNSDDTCTITISLSLLGESASESQDGTYKQDGSTVTIDSDAMGGEQEFKIEGGKLVMEEVGSKIVFSAK